MKTKLSLVAFIAALSSCSGTGERLDLDKLQRLSVRIIDLAEELQDQPEPTRPVTGEK